jgi:hypothetical protein
MIVKDFVTSDHTQTIPFELVKNQRMILAPLGDIHFDTEDFPLKRFKDHIEWMMDRGAYFVGMGDYLDFMPHSQRALLAPLRDSVKGQIDTMIRKKADELLEVLAPTKGRWLGLVEGNHRWDFHDGTSLDQYLCEGLSCDFLGTMALVRIVSKDMPEGHPEASCTLCVHHGIGSSRLTGGHMHRVEDLLKWIDADIYLMGHSHAKIGAPIDVQTISLDGAHYHRTKIMARTGSWLLGYASHEPLGLDEPVMESRGSYVEEKAFMPSALGGLCIGIGFEQIHKSKYYRPTIHFSI